MMIMSTGCCETVNEVAKFVWVWSPKYTELVSVSLDFQWWNGVRNFGINRVKLVYHISQASMATLLLREHSGKLSFHWNIVKIWAIYLTTAIILLLCVIHKDIKSCLNMKLQSTIIQNTQVLCLPRARPFSFLSPILPLCAFTQLVKYLW